MWKIVKIYWNLQKNPWLAVLFLLLNFGKKFLFADTFTRLSLIPYRFESLWLRAIVEIQEKESSQ